MAILSIKGAGLAVAVDAVEAAIQCEHEIGAAGIAEARGIDLARFGLYRQAKGLLGVRPKSQYETNNDESAFPKTSGHSLNALSPRV